MGTRPIVSAVSIDIQNINKCVKINNRLAIITGHNGAGKSALGDCIHFALKGNIVGLSGKDRDIWAEISAGKASCGATVSGPDLLIERCLTRVGATTKHSGSVNGGDKLNSKAALEGAISAVGADKIRLLSMTDFFGFSDPKKIAFLAGFYTGKDYTTSSVLSKFDKKYHPLAKITSKVAHSMELLDLIEAKIKKLKTNAKADKTSAGVTILNLSAEQEKIERPAGQLHEVEKEIVSLNQTASAIRADLTEAGGNKAKLEAWQSETQLNFDAIAHVEKELRPELKIGGPGLKSPRDYDWQMNRCRDEKRKSQATPDSQMIDFANEMIRGMNDAGCGKACSAIMIAKKKILSSRPKTIDLKALEEEFRGWERLRNLSAEMERLIETKDSLTLDPRSKLLTSSQDETEQAAEGIATRLTELQDTKTAMVSFGNLNSSIENTRLSKVEAETELKNIKLAEAELKKIRSGIAKAIFQPAKEAVDKYLPNGESVFDFDANGKLLIAWHIEHRERRTPRLRLSGAERSQFDAILSAGLLSLLGQDIKAILIIKTGEVSRQNLIPFCKTLEQAPENVQILVETWLDNDIPAPKIDGWETVVMEY